MNNTFDYRNLKGRIISKYETLSKFYEIVGISNEWGSKKMTSKAGFSQDDIVYWSGLLDIDLKDVGSYFYVLKVQP